MIVIKSKGKIMDKRIITGLLSIGVVAFFGTDAMAATCALRSSSGTCLYYTKGILGDIVTDNTAIAKKNTQVVLDVHPIGVDGAPATGIVTCGNPGKNGKPSPGIQSVFLLDFTFFFDDLISQAKAITKADITAGVGEVLITDFFPTKAGTNPCPNPGWIVLDAVACDTSNAVILETNDVPPIGIETATQVCHLAPTVCQTLSFNPANGIFQQQQYSCSAPVVTTP